VITLETRPKLAAKARLRFDRKSGKHMLLYPEKGLLLNPTSASILELCTGEHTVLAIVEQLRARYSGGTEESVKAEVLSFLEAMAAKALLEVGP
jgi:coenzyme PQQ biosynthesis protein PqqD